MEVNEILKKITDFNIEDDFYDNDAKKEVAKALGDLLEVEDEKTRKFLKKWLEDTKKLADKMDMDSVEEEEPKEDEEENDAESEEDYKSDEEPTGDDEATSDEDETAPPESDDEEEKKDESVEITEATVMVSRASRYLM